MTKPLSITTPSFDFSFHELAKYLTRCTFRNELTLWRVFWSLHVHTSVLGPGKHKISFMPSTACSSSTATCSSLAAACLTACSFAAACFSAASSSTVSLAIAFLTAIMTPRLSRTGPGLYPCSERWKRRPRGFHSD